MFALRSRKTAAILAAGALAGAGLIGGAPAADAAARTAQVTNLRTAGHTTYDRVVIDYKGKQPAVKVTLVNSLYSCAKGDKLSIPGDKILSIDLTPASAHNQKGQNVYSGPGRLSTTSINLATIRGVRMACDFEGHVTFGIGVDHNVKKIAFGFLSDPKRIYVDLKS